MKPKELDRNSSLTVHHFFTVLNFIILLLAVAWLLYDGHILRNEIEILKTDIRPLIQQNKKTASRPFSEFVSKSRNIRQVDPGSHGGGGGHGMVMMTEAPKDGGGHGMMTMAPDGGHGGGHSMMTGAPQIEPGPHEENANKSTGAPSVEAHGGANATTGSPDTGSIPHGQSDKQSTASSRTSVPSKATPHGGMDGMEQSTDSSHGESSPSGQGVSQSTENPTGSSHTTNPTVQTPHGGMDGMEVPQPHSTPVKFKCAPVSIPEECSLKFWSSIGFFKATVIDNWQIASERLPTPLPLHSENTSLYHVHLTTGGRVGRDGVKRIWCIALVDTGADGTILFKFLTQ